MSDETKCHPDVVVGETLCSCATDGGCGEAPCDGCAAELDAPLLAERRAHAATIKKLAKRDERIRKMEVEEAVFKERATRSIESFFVERDRLRAEREILKASNKRLINLLRKLEWAGQAVDSDEGPHCKICGNVKPKHKSGCALEAELRSF